MLTLAFGFGGAAVAQQSPSTPLPPPRPGHEPKPIPGTVKPETSAPPIAEEKAAPLDVPSCIARLKNAGFDVDPAEPPRTANAQCQIDTPVRIKSIPSRQFGSDAKVTLTEEPILACRFAESLGQWLGTLAAPVMKGGLNTELKAVRTGPGFECRNRASGGKLSAHAEGLAIDISSFELADGTVLRVKIDSDERSRSIHAAIRTAACGWFTTVLGPGSNADHSDHLHVDIQKHGSSENYRICE